MLLLLLVCIAAASAAPFEQRLPEPIARVSLNKIPKSPVRLLRGSLMKETLEMKHGREAQDWASVTISNFADAQYYGKTRKLLFVAEAN
jgi:hypothetical protein